MRELIKEKTKAGVSNLMTSIRTKTYSIQAEHEVKLASQVLGEARVVREQGDGDKKLSKNPVFKVNKDTYAMAFRALHWETQHDMCLQTGEISNAFHSAVIVFVIQIIMLFVFSTVIFGEGNPNPISMARTPLVMGLRVMVSILMHLQVEGDTR